MGRSGRFVDKGWSSKGATDVRQHGRALLALGLLFGPVACSSSSSPASSNPDASMNPPDANTAVDAGPGGDGASPLSTIELPPTPQPDCAADAGDWTMFGHNVCNTSAPAPGGGPINRASVKTLKTKWTYTATGPISATPAVVGGRVYVPDWGGANSAGSISCVDATTGKAVWSKDIGGLITSVDAGPNLGGFMSRTTPIVTATSVIFGTQRQGGPLITASTYSPGAYVVALDKNTGAVQWITPVHDNHPAAVVASSAVYDGTNIYFGVGSSEEAFANYNPNYQCCNFRGSLYAVNATTGAIVWRTHTISDALYYGDGGAEAGVLAGYSGNAQWSSNAVIDRKRKALYITTGNNYTIPAGAPGTTPGNAVDAIVALDLATGNVKWMQSVPEGGEDAWNYATPGGNTGNQDSDFGSGANFFTALIKGVPTDLVGAGQKSGLYFAVNPDTGAIVWKTAVGPGGHLGGMHWGTSTDGIRIYMGLNNPGSAVVLAGNGPQAGKMTSTGIFSALDPATGDILWQIADPAPPKTFAGATLDGPVVVVNDVLFGGSMDENGTMFAFDAKTGDVLWSFQSGGSVYGGPAVVGDTVYWGSGYPNNRLGFGGPGSASLFAFQLQ